MNEYENMSDEVKEVYVLIIENYLGLSLATVSQITPEIAKEVDNF